MRIGSMLILAKPRPKVEYGNSSARNDDAKNPSKDEAPTPINPLLNLY